MGPSYRSGPGFCPTINATESQEILVAAGIKKAIRVKVHIIGVCKNYFISLIIVKYFSFHPNFITFLSSLLRFLFRYVALPHGPCKATELEQSSNSFD